MASNILSWQSTRAALDAALGTSTQLFAELGASTSNRLAAAGARLDAAFSTNGAYDTWRAAAIAGLTDVDALCAAIDGDPAASFGDGLTSVATYRASVDARVAAARAIVGPLASSVSRASSLARSQAAASVASVRGRRPEAERLEANALESIAAAAALTPLV